MSDAKFQWFNAMYADREIPLAQRGIIGYCGIRYAKASQGYVIQVNQRTIAENLGTTTKTVGESLRAGERQAWLQKKERAKGGRGHHGGDTWVLSIPIETPNGNDPSLEETPNGNGTSFDETPNENAGNPQPKSEKPPTETAETYNWTNAPTSENAVPKGIEKGIEEGYLEQGMDAAAAPAAGGGGVPSDRLCEDCLTALDDEGCPRCRLRSGSWRKSGGAR